MYTCLKFYKNPWNRLGFYQIKVYPHICLKYTEFCGIYIHLGWQKDKAILGGRWRNKESEKVPWPKCSHPCLILHPHLHPMHQQDQEDTTQAKLMSKSKWDSPSPKKSLCWTICKLIIWPRSKLLSTGKRMITEGEFHRGIFHCGKGWGNTLLNMLVNCASW